MSPARVGELRQNACRLLVKRPTRSAKKFGIGLVIIVVFLAALTPILLNVRRAPLQGGGGGPRNAFSPGPAYDSLASLKGNSTLVVLVSVTKVNATYCEQTSLGPDCNQLNTDFQVEVLSYLKGTGPQSIYVADGPSPGSPILLMGNEYVLFLVNNWNCLQDPREPPCTLPPTALSVTYYAQGGPQGKFVLQNGLVYGFKTLYPHDNDWFRVDANGVPLAEFIAEVHGT